MVMKLSPNDSQFGCGPACAAVAVASAANATADVAMVSLINLDSFTKVPPVKV